MTFPDFFQRYKPGATKKSLMLVAGCLWSFAGSLLLFRGLHFLIPENHQLLLSLTLGAVAGTVFFYLLFFKLSKKHIKRIHDLKVDRPCIFSFFNWKSYLVMLIMITMGISLSKLNSLPPHELHLFFIIMSVPLLLSGIRFISQSRMNKQLNINNLQQGNPE